MPSPNADSPRDDALFDEVRELLRRGASRLRRRHLVRGAIYGGWVGGVLGLTVAGLSRLWWPLPFEPSWVVAGVVPLAAVVGSVIDGARVGLRPREVALLLDRTLGTDELLVTALHLEKAPPSWSQSAVNARLRQRLDAHPALGVAVPLVTPKRSRWLGLLLAAAVALLFVPERPGARGVDEPGTALGDEAARLEERIAELDEEFEVDLPEDLEKDVADLVEQLRSGDLDEQAAQERIADLQEQVKALQDELEPSRLALEDIESAAQALSESAATRDLGDALAAMDPEEAAEAARELAESLSQMKPEERQQAAEALQEAGERLKESGDAGLRQAGEQMERTGRGIAGEGQQGAGSEGEDGQQGSESGQQGSESGQQGSESGQQGSESGQQGSESGQQGSEGGQQGSEGQQGSDGQQGSQGQQGTGGQQGSGSQGSGGQGASDLQRLADELERQESLAERLKADGERLAQSQELNGALEGSDQRLGGGQSLDPGEGGTPGEGQPGGPEGANVGGLDYGVGHTWEDEGTTASAGGGHHDADRSSDRVGGKELDDFERLYDPVRLQGSQGLLTGVDGTIDESGHIEVLPTRLTGAHEDASSPLVALPLGYREAADEALSGERVPAGYREAVKQYFDGME